MPDVQQDAATSVQAGLAAAAERMRTSTKWLIASFGAAAAVVVAGIGLSDLGRLSGDTPGYRLAIAVGGALAAIIGVLGALATAMALAAASAVTIDDLTATPRRGQRSLEFALSKIRRDPALAPWKGDLAAFVQDLAKSRSHQKVERDAYMKDSATSPEQSHLNRATYLVNELEAILARLLETASFLRLQRSFSVARAAIVAWLLLAAVGVLAFVYAVRTGPAALTVPGSPIAASVRVPTNERAYVAKQLGKSCDYDLDAVPVVVLSIDNKTTKAQVVTLPTDRCQPVRVEVGRDRISGAPPRLGGEGTGN
jgi:hypothetical protein